MGNISDKTKAIMKKIEGMGYDVEFEMDEEYGDDLMIYADNNEISITTEFHGPFVYIDGISADEFINQRTIDEILRFYESYAADNGKIFFVNQNELYGEVRFEIKPYLEKNGYEKIGELADKINPIIDFYADNDNYIKKQKRTKAERLINLYSSFLEAIEDAEENLPAFERMKKFWKEV